MSILGFSQKLCHIIADGYFLELVSFLPQATLVPVGNGHWGGRSLPPESIRLP